jgi:Fur family transcriptional regulator, ferric uptake regulator
VDPDLRRRWLENAHRRTAGAGLRSGAVRSAVIDHLASEGQCLQTAQQVIDALREQRRGSAASVYRVLEELYELGLLHRLDGRDGTARFEIADPDTHHHHVVDERTGDVQPFVDEDLERAIASAADRLGLEMTGHDVVLRGRLDASAGT